jgi:hypothetical protein
MRRGRLLIAVALAIAVLAVGAASCRREVASSLPPVGATAPGISLTESGAGVVVNLPADRSGKPYSVTFFSYG